MSCLHIYINFVECGLEAQHFILFHSKLYDCIGGKMGLPSNNHVIKY